MTPLAVFYQPCPVCGRSIRMPVQYFGREVTCVHCGGEFRADDQASVSASADDGAKMPGMLSADLGPLGSLPLADGR